MIAKVEKAELEVNEANERVDFTKEAAINRHSYEKKKEKNQDTPYKLRFLALRSKITCTF